MSHVKIKDVEIYTYKLPYLQYKSREGLILKISDESGAAGFGEIAPYPEKSQESYSDALAAAKKFREKVYLNDLSPTPFPPSVFFGIESALTQLTLKSDEKIPFQYYDLHIPSLSSHTYHNQIPKLKLGDLSLESAIKEATLVLEHIERVRIDLNRKWPLEKTLAFTKRFHPEQILYVEDPVENFTDLEIFFAESNVPYAVDEFLFFQPLETIKALSGLSHIIIKPTLHGGQGHIAKLLEQIGSTDVCFSSLFESAVGLINIITLAHKLRQKHPLGIGTYRYFQEDLLPMKAILAKGYFTKEDLQELTLESSAAAKI